MKEKRVKDKKGCLITILFGLAGIVVFFIFGLLIVNYIVMPLIIHGKGVVKIPDVVGMNKEEAVKILSKAGLNPVIYTEKPDTAMPKDAIIEQNPKAELEVRKGRSVFLTVSRGPELTRFPYLIGLSIEKAQQILERNGFTITQIDTTLSDSIDPGIVVSTSPPPDKEVSKGIAVRITIAGGTTENLFMPYLVELTFDEAKDIIARESLYLAPPTFVNEEGKEGIVISQMPDFGVKIEKGDTVYLTVGKE